MTELLPYLTYCLKYRKVVSRSTSRVSSTPMVFRLFMKGKLDAFDKKSPKLNIFICKIEKCLLHLMLTLQSLHSICFISNTVNKGLVSHFQNSIVVA